jgi:hypothetical protein
MELLQLRLRCANSSTGEYRYINNNYSKGYSYRHHPLYPFDGVKQRQLTAVYIERELHLRQAAAAL